MGIVSARSNESNQFPNYVYRILMEPPPQPFPPIFPPSLSDINDGFIHLSTANQL
ncbi:unnamed protein product, partial [Rotaria sordida]